LTQAWLSGLFYKIIKSSVFEGISLLVIILNSITLAIDDPTTEE